MSLSIIGTGRAVPDLVVTNHDMQSIVDTSDEWIVSRTGISNRRILKEDTLLDLAETAAKQALSASNTKPEDLDLILFGTVFGDYITPSMACLLQTRLGCACPGFDINAACSGFIYALDVASAYFLAGKAKRILVVCAEELSKITNWEDRSTCVLFGDGAGAAVLAPGEDLLAIRLHVEPSAGHLFARAPGRQSPFSQKDFDANGIYMNGQEVYKFAVSTIASEAGRLLAQTGLTADDVDLFLLHQANRRIIETARIRLKQPAEKFPINIGEYGNTSSASIPILMDELFEQGRLKAGQTLFLCAFGAGFTSGACLIKWNHTPKF